MLGCGTAGPHLHVRRRTDNESLKLRGDRAARLRYTMDAFQRWLFDTAGNQQPVDPTLFFAAPGAYFAGSVICGDELYEALAYLAEHKLIERIDTRCRVLPIRPYSTNACPSGVGRPSRPNIRSRS
ncbi:hypothetical protein [Streptomyces sp. NPDC055287]